jgi:hypothetical protein
VGKLTDWCAGQPAWAVDAMQRAASCSQDVDAEVNALVCRIGLAHGLAIDGENLCQPFTEESVVAVGNSPDDVVLHSVGPLRGLDRLAGDQVLKFVLDGITIVFGDNGSGKSGYTRALRQLTCVREDAPLEGDVFATGSAPSKSIAYTYRVGEADAVTATWREGQSKPAVLEGVTLLDTDNLRVYVNGKSNILYMPPEPACVGRLADLYQAASARYRGWIDDASRRAVRRRRSVPALPAATRRGRSRPPGSLRRLCGGTSDAGGRTRRRSAGASRLGTAGPVVQGRGRAPDATR